MSVNLSVRPHASKGRALHTTKALKPGQIIATFSPTLLLTSSGHLKSICSYCFKRGEPRACKQCRVAYYCDAKCQVAAWQSVHKSECMLLTKSVSSVSKRREMPTPIRALIQILLNQGLDGGVLKDLEGHVSQRRGQPGWADWEMMAMAACAFAGLGTEEEVVSKAVSLLCKVNSEIFIPKWSITKKKTARFIPTPSTDMMQISGSMASFWNRLWQWSITLAFPMLLFNLLVEMLC